MDYISFFECLFLILLTPTLLVKNKLDYLICFMWVSASIFSKSPIFIGDYPTPVLLTNQTRATEVLVMLALFSLIHKAKFNKTKVLEKIAVIAVVASVICIPFNTRWVTGLVPNKSMNAILIASLICYLPNFYFFIAAIILIIISKSSSAYLALGSVLTYCFFNDIKAHYKKWLLGALIGVGLLFLLDNNLFNPYSRFQGYKFFFKDFNLTNWFFGKGPGSFFAISAYRQKTELFDLESGYWLYLHSDILQFIYEYGLVSLIFLGLSLCHIIKLEKRAMTVVLALCFGGLFYYPLHSFHHLLVLLLAISSYEKHEQYI